MNHDPPTQLLGYLSLHPICKASNPFSRCCSKSAQSCSPFVPFSHSAQPGTRYFLALQGKQIWSRCRRKLLFQSRIRDVGGAGRWCRLYGHALRAGGLLGREDSGVRIRCLCLLVVGKIEWTGSHSHVRIGSAPLPSTGRSAVGVLHSPDFFFSACQAEDLRSLLDRLSRVRVLSPSRSGESCALGMLKRSSSILNCRWIKNGFRSLAFGRTRARMVTRFVEWTWKSSFISAKLGRRKLTALINASAVSDFPRYA
jgi:hypothetical protein